MQCGPDWRLLVGDLRPLVRFSPSSTLRYRRSGATPQRNLSRFKCQQEPLFIRGGLPLKGFFLEEEAKFIYRR